MRQSRPDKQPTEWCLRASTVSPAEPTISAMGGLDPDAPREGTDPSLPWAPLGWPWPFIWRGGWGIRGRQGSSCTLYCALYRTLSSKQLAHVGIERRGPPCVRGVRVSGGIPCAPRCCSRRWRPDGRELNVNVCLTGASVRECDSWTSMESVGASSVQQVREVRRAWTACGAGATKFKWPRWCMQVSRLRSGVMTSLQLQQPGSHSSQLTAHRSHSRWEKASEADNTITFIGRRPTGLSAYHAPRHSVSQLGICSDHRHRPSGDSLAGQRMTNVKPSHHHAQQVGITVLRMSKDVSANLH